MDGDDSGLLAELSGVGDDYRLWRLDYSGPTRNQPPQMGSRGWLLAIYPALAVRGCRMEVSAEYRVLSSEEFWTGCWTAVRECQKAGFDEEQMELREKFLKIFLSVHPVIGCC